MSPWLRRLGNNFQRLRLKINIVIIIIIIIATVRFIVFRSFRRIFKNNWLINPRKNLNDKLGFKNIKFLRKTSMRLHDCRFKSGNSVRTIYSTPRNTIRSPWRQFRFSPHTEKREPTLKIVYWNSTCGLLVLGFEGVAWANKLWITKHFCNVTVLRPI